MALRESQALLQVPDMLLVREALTLEVEGLVAAAAKTEFELAHKPGKQGKIGGKDCVDFSRLRRKRFGAGGEERHFSGEGIGRE